jgi:hypothetical protein
VNITTEHKVEALADGAHSRLTILVFLDGKFVNSNVALSGPTPDVQEYMDGKVTLDELDERWRTKKVGRVGARALPVRDLPPVPGPAPVPPEAPSEEQGMTKPEAEEAVEEKNEE